MSEVMRLKTAGDVLAQTIYLVVGCPGSGKSWACEQLRDEFTYVHHDLFIKMAGTAYVEEIKVQAMTSAKPILIEAPFSISQIKDPLDEAGFVVVPMVIQEEASVIQRRYETRDGKPIPQGHLTRQLTYGERALAHGWFMGTSEQVMKHLRGIAAMLVKTGGVQDAC